jgi:hypothetical protein
MITLILDIEETGASHKAEGKNFGEASLDLLDKISREYGSDCLDDGYIFEALAGVLGKDDSIYTHADFSLPEANFTLTLFR